VTVIRPYNTIFSNLPSLSAKQAADPEVVATGSRVLLIGQLPPQDSSLIAAHEDGFDRGATWPFDPLGSHEKTTVRNSGQNCS
jgi:hypothetical protein